jgi:hypothetical protein
MAISSWDTLRLPSLFSKLRVKGLDWFEDASHGKAHPQSDDTILEVRPVGDYDNVHYVWVGTLRNKSVE